MEALAVDESRQMEKVVGVSGTPQRMAETDT
jgi:hypothetical protein